MICDFCAGFSLSSPSRRPAPEGSVPHPAGEKGQWEAGGVHSPGSDGRPALTQWVEWARPAPPCLYSDSTGTHLIMTQISSCCPAKPEGCHCLLWVNTPTVHLNYLINFYDIQSACPRGESLRSWWHMWLWLLRSLQLLWFPQDLCHMQGHWLCIERLYPECSQCENTWGKMAGLFQGRRLAMQSEEPPCHSPWARWPHASGDLYPPSKTGNVAPSGVL